MTKSLLAFTVNGERVELAVWPHWTLLEVLRYELGLTGSKQGCDKGDCGACTVRLDGDPVLACLTLAMTVRDREVVTIEGLARGGKLDPVQDAFDECGALQCGFCQSGMMISARALLDERPAADEVEIRRALSGNLCRCTGYTKIFEAVRRAQDLEAAQNADEEPAATAT
ncbi:MAG: (2Fe-2S)-binding protein [Deltaproteobacteria bacterium]|nr:(2Fe-2S)-binding protein [Deltaproteobacteria bacterium]